MSLLRKVSRQEIISRGDSSFMNRLLIQSLLIGFYVLSEAATAAFPAGVLSNDRIFQEDTLYDNQLLYNGRIWRNIYYQVEGHPFLLSGAFLPGSVTMHNRIFNDVSLQYDVYKDELLTPIEAGMTLQLNKEMVDSFSFHHQHKTYCFTNLHAGYEGLSGYVQVIYNGKTALYLKYGKKIDRPGVEGKNDRFSQYSRIFFVQHHQAYPLSNKRDLYKVLTPNKKEIKDWVRKSQLRVSMKDPESYIPILRYAENSFP